MKNLKLKIFTLLAFVLFPFLASAGTILQEEGLSISILAVASAGAIAILLSAISGAINHVLAGTFDKELWWADSGRPAMWTFIIYIVLALIDVYIPFLDAIVEMLFSVETDAGNTALLISVAYALFPVVKGLFNIEQTKAKSASTIKQEKLLQYKK